MPDMLVKLYTLNDKGEDTQRLADEGIIIRRAQPYESSTLRQFILDNFGEGWADESQVAFSHQPVTCFIATREKKIIGFAAYECTRRGFFGPTGVQESDRGKGIGKALLMSCMRAMLEMGYAYAIIGGVGPVYFYEKCVNAIPIPDSTPGIYVDILDS